MLPFFYEFQNHKTFLGYTTSKKTLVLLNVDVNGNIDSNKRERKMNYVTLCRR